MNLETIGGLSLTGVVIFIVGWLIRQWLEAKIKADVEHKYNKELESFKQALTTESTKQIEQLKSGLEIAASEKQLRFSQMYAETVKHMYQFHQKLIACDNQANNALDEEAFTDEAFESMAKAEEDLAEYWKMNSLFFPTECDDNIQEIFNVRKTLVSILIELSNARGRNDERTAEIRKAEYKTKRMDYFKMLKLVGGDFRVYMGVETKPATDKK